MSELKSSVIFGRRLVDFSSQKFQMGCAASDTSHSQTKTSSKPVANGVHKDKAEEPKTDGGKTEDERVAVFKQLLMEKLMSIANEPPMKPLQPVEGTERTILVPSIFNCQETLAELNDTGIPTNSNVVVTYLKSGTHWVWELMKMLKKKQAVADGIPKEMGHLEFFPPSVLRKINGSDMPVYATHFPLWCLPKSAYTNSQLVYVYRNPKDVCVSLFYHFQGMSEANPKDFPPLSFDQLFEMFMGPSEANLMGSWFDHVADYWDNHRTNTNVLCVMYEQLKKDPVTEIKRIDKHIGSGATDGLVQEVVDATAFKTLKKTKESSEQHIAFLFKGTMYRKGEVGDWKNYFSDEQSRRLDERLEQWQKERAEPVPLIFEL
ncbi:SULT6B1 [Bugula neritina]|uniref:SULT6B1 n=1 Tax=Bugula neritina TaxID=10212 RepID=A0A7J7JG88_BUGNE|nr:SULT6B1 [Bugula neritina]